MSAHNGFIAGGVPDAKVDSHEPAIVRAQILQLEDACRDMPQVDCPLNHYYAPGLYAREIFIPAGTVVVGKIHRHAHMNVISHGIVTVVTEFGRTRMAAPFTFVSEPGTKRSLVAETDIVWTTIHSNPNELTDHDALEAEIIAPNYASIGVDFAGRLE